MYKRYLVMVGLLVLGFAAYAWWWFDKSEEFESTIEGRIVTAMPSNVEVKVSIGEIGGFPFRFVADLEDLEVTVGETDIFTTPQAEAVVQPGNSDHVILRFAAPISYQTKKLGEGTVTAERLLASLTHDQVGRSLIDLDVRNLAVDAASGRQFGGERVGVHVRDTSVGSDYAYQFSITGAGLHDLVSPTATARLIAEGEIRHADFERAVAAGAFVPRMLVQAELKRFLFEAADYQIKQSYTANFSNLATPELTMRVDASRPGEALEAMWKAGVVNSAAIADLLEQYGEFSGDALVLHVAYDAEGLAVNGTTLSPEDAAVFFDLF